MSGWIKLHRKILESQIWTSEPFSRGQAWVDLLLLANHEYGFFYLRDHKIEVQRGQVGWSHLKLSQRWKWSRTKVKRFIKDLEKEQQVVQQQSHSTSVITILNYEEYQEKEQQKDNRKATEKQQKDTNKKNKEEYKKKEEYNIYTFELFKNRNKKYANQYLLFIKTLYGKVGHHGRMNNVLKLEQQCTYDSFVNVYMKALDKGKKLLSIIMAMDNKKDLTKRYKSVSKTALNWLDQ